jgi:AraC family transcriptional regulator of adaptative response / DNA-3-methyladenine glycosylase II
VESISDGVYRRAVCARDAAGEQHVGALEVALGRRPDQLAVRIDEALLSGLRAILAGLRRLFDLDADPRGIDEALGAHPEFGPSVRATPGVRVPGAFDGFEVALHAVLSQAVTVRCAERFCERAVRRFGESISTDDGHIAHLAPTAKAIARAPLEELRSIGLTGARAGALRAVARLACAAPEHFEPGADGSARAEALAELPGIGPWTIAYLALRLGDPDAFPASDLGLRRALASETVRPSAREVLARSHPWRPWRAYAAMHLWHRDAQRSSHT